MPGSEPPPTTSFHPALLKKDWHPFPVSIKGSTPLLLPAVGLGRQSLPTQPPPNPHEIAPDQRLENVQQRLFVAAKQLKHAADSGNQSHAEQAFHYAHATISDVR